MKFRYIHMYTIYIYIYTHIYTSLNKISTRTMFLRGRNNYKDNDNNDNISNIDDNNDKHDNANNSMVCRYIGISISIYLSIYISIYIYIYIYIYAWTCGSPRPRRPRRTSRTRATFSDFHALFQYFLTFREKSPAKNKTMPSWVDVWFTSTGEGEAHVKAIERCKAADIQCML